MCVLSLYNIHCILYTRHIIRQIKILIFNMHLSPFSFLTCSLLNESPKLSIIKSVKRPWTIQMQEIQYWQMVLLHKQNMNKWNNSISYINIIYFVQIITPRTDTNNIYWDQKHLETIYLKFNTSAKLNVSEALLFQIKVQLSKVSIQ